MKLTLGVFIILLILLTQTRTDLLDKLENVINDKNTIIEDMTSSFSKFKKELSNNDKDVNLSMQKTKPDDSSSTATQADSKQQQRSIDIISENSSSSAKDNSQTTSNPNIQNDHSNAENPYINTNQIANVSTTNNNLQNSGMINNYGYNSPYSYNTNNYSNSQYQSNYQTVQNFNSVGSTASNSFSFSNQPTANNFNNLDINQLGNSQVNSQGNMNNDLQEDSDVIFEHVFISMNGDKDFPEFRSRWTFDQYNNELVVPEEIIKEDDITKIKRIYSILDTMNLFNNVPLLAKGSEKDKTPNFVTPPILNGFESRLKQINNNDEKFRNENIKNSVIKDDNDNNIIENEKIVNRYSLIRSPPNFLF